MHYQPLLLTSHMQIQDELPDYHWLHVLSQTLTPPSFAVLPTAPEGFRTGPNRFARRYSGRRFCFRFLPLLICLSSGSSLSLLTTEVRQQRVLANQKLHHSAIERSKLRSSLSLFAYCCGLPRSLSRRIHRPALLFKKHRNQLQLGSTGRFSYRYLATT